MRQFSQILLAAIAFSITALSASAAELKLEARLIWGANDEKETIKYHAVDPELSDKLHHAFKWKNYYEINKQLSSIPVNESRDIKMSDVCIMRVKNLGHSRVEVSCIGHGKQVHKGAYTLVPPEWLVLGSKDSDNSAWFVGLRTVDAKTAKN